RRTPRSGRSAATRPRGWRGTGPGPGGSRRWRGSRATGPRGGSGPGGGGPRDPRTGRRPRGQAPGWRRTRPAPWPAPGGAGGGGDRGGGGGRGGWEGRGGGPPERPGEPPPPVRRHGQFLGGQGVGGQAFEDLLRAAEGRIGGRVRAQLLLDLADPSRRLARL